LAQDQPTRREVLKGAVYVTPAILTLVAIPAFASSGSGRGMHEDQPRSGRGMHEDKPTHEPKH